MSEDILTVTYRGIQLRTNPPRNGLQISKAMREFRVASRTIWKAIKDGKLRAGLSRSRTRRSAVIVYLSDMKRVFGERGRRGTKAAAAKAPSDGVPITDLAREFGEDVGAYPTLWHWCQWEPHPALGRRLRCGIKRRQTTDSRGRTYSRQQLLLSRADVAACVEIIKNPFHRSIPGNSGVWIAEGIFRHNDGRLFFTARYVESHRETYGMSRQYLFAPSYLKRLDSLRVTWPQKRAHPNGRWWLTVFSEASLNRLVERLAGRVDGGDWLDFGDIWRDGDGLWYSTDYLARHLKLTRFQVCERYRTPDRQTQFKKLTQFKKVPLSRKQGRHGTAVVHHESEVRPLLGIGGGTMKTTRARERRKPEQAKHLKWKQWKDSGLSYNQILDKEEDDTGIRPSRSAVVMALRRPK